MVLALTQARRAMPTRYQTILWHMYLRNAFCCLTEGGIWCFNAELRLGVSSETDRYQPAITSVRCDHLETCSSETRLSNYFLFLLVLPRNTIIPADEAGMSLKVITVGAGIAGLLAAIAFRRHGHEVLVLERREEFSGDEGRSGIVL